MGFLWLGTYIAKKITVPLEALAEGSRELAEGNLDHRVDVSAVDELGILVDSFNRMGEEIKQNRGKL
ncbi:MAG: HAMP domain-containing protein, partial [Acidobacteriota bacterium]